MIEEIVYYVRRINSLGLQQSAVRTVRKIKESYLRSYWRKKAYNGTAAYTWQDITKKHVYTQSFDQFCIEQKRHQLSFYLSCINMFRINRLLLMRICLCKIVLMCLVQVCNILQRYHGILILD